MTSRHINSHWLECYKTVKQRFTWRQRLWHLVWPPVMMDPKTERCYEKYAPEGMFIMVHDPNNVPRVGPKGKPYGTRSKQQQ